jgi:hypothetical protein
MANSPAPISLRSRLSGPDIVVAPGIYDALTASLAEAACFGALYLSGAALAYTLLGGPDLGLVTGDVNDFTRKGRHTTTVATLHTLGPEARLIDTPGVRAWSLDGVPLARVAARFPGLTEAAL